jgi:hypothetical protein
MVIYILEKVHPKCVYNKKYPLTGDHIGIVTESKRQWVKEYNEMLDRVNLNQFKPVLHSLAQGMYVPSVRQFENTA